MELFLPGIGRGRCSGVGGFGCLAEVDDGHSGNANTARTPGGGRGRGAPGGAPAGGPPATGGPPPAGIFDFHCDKVLIRFDREMPLQVGGDAEGYRSEVVFEMAERPLDLLDFRARG